MEKFSKILKYFLGIIVVLTILNSFVIGLPKFGKVVDSATKQPLGDILVSRITTVGGGGHGNPERLVRTDSVRTDNEGKFYLGPYLKFRFPFQRKKDLVNVNVILLPPERLLYNSGGFENKNYFGEGYESGMASFYKETGRKIYYNISLVPIVADEKQCQGDSKCIDDNKRWGRICAGRDDLQPCKDIHAIAQYTQSQEITEELLSCNREPNDAKVAECLLKFKYGPDKVIFTDSACSKINSELGRNYCYYWIASNARFYPREVCDKITAKLIPNTLDYLVFSGDIQGNNYLDACLRAYELYKGDKGESPSLNF